MCFRGDLANKNMRSIIAVSSIADSYLNSAKVKAAMLHCSVVGDACLTHQCLQPVLSGL